MSGGTRTTGKPRALALALVVLAVSAGTLQGSTPSATAAPLDAGSDFTISSTVSQSSAAPDRPALLQPGVTRYLWYSVTNQLRTAITVTAVGLSDVAAPAACPVSNLELGDPTFTGSFVVSAGSTRTIPAPMPISLIDLPDVNQDACKDVAFAFTFTGTAHYSDLPESDLPESDLPESDLPEQVARIGTTTRLITGTGLVAVGNPVRLSATVGRIGGGKPPSGTVSFLLTDARGARVLLGTALLGSESSASLQLRSLPAGTSSLVAAYAGTDEFEGSDSAAAVVTAVAPPARCTATYTTSIVGTPDSPAITGTRGNDFIYAVGGNYRIKAGKGSDCVVVGDGNNVISDGSGADVVVAGNGTNRIRVTGSRNTVRVGNGAGNRITVKGTKKVTKKGVKFRTTSRNRITVGDGPRNRVTIAKGFRNVVTLGHGRKNRVTVTGAKATCSLPHVPGLRQSATARHYRDTVLRCRVVTR